MKAKKVTKTALGFTMAAALVATSLVIPAGTEEAEAATTWTFTYPTTAMEVEDQYGKRVLTTLTQRAASEIPLVFGVNVIGGNAFDGLLNLAGTYVNENPDPYVWNYNYSETTGVELATGQYGVAYSNIGNDLTNPNGLYQSGGGNQAYGEALEELGGVGYAIGWRTDVIFSFNSTLVDQIDMVRNGTYYYTSPVYETDEEGNIVYETVTDNRGNTSQEAVQATDEDGNRLYQTEYFETSDFYQEGDEDYSPLLADVQTAGVSARLYAWTDMGHALSAYLDDHEDLTTRYDDPEAIGANVAQFSAGIPYYIASLINDNVIDKKTAAYVSRISDNTLTVVNPKDVGSVSADVYAEVQNFEFIEGTYTLQQLMEEEDVDIIMLGASGYSYAGASGNSTTTTNKTAILTELADLGYDEDTVPMVMDSSSIGVTIGNNGYNYAPTTPMFMPYAQVYAYMDELEEAVEAGTVDASINPVAMVMYMFDEFAHVKDESVEDVAFYYIGSNWDPVDSELDQVPDQENYTYDKDAIEAAILEGIEYAQSDDAEKNGNVLMPAYSTSETAYALLTESATETKPDDMTNVVTVTVNGVEKYLDLNALIESDDDEESEEDDGHGGYASVRTNYEAIIDYYNSGEYGYGDDLQTTLQTYADHMVEHVWDPDTTVLGSYTNPAADYTEVYEALEAAYELNADNYVDFSEVEAAIDAVVYDLEDDYQDDVDAMAQAIKDAIANLVLNGNAATLQVAYDYSEVLIGLLDESDYTEESWEALINAQTALKSLLDAGNASQDDMDAAIDALSEAANALVAAEVEVVEWTGDTIGVRSGNTFYFYDEIGNTDYSLSLNYGKSTDEILVGDWDGDGVETLCVRRGNTYYFSNDSTFTKIKADFTLHYGKSTDEVLVGDWDGDGCDTLCVRRGNTYYFSNDETFTSIKADKVLNYGKGSDEVLVGDWDGNGSVTLCVRRNGTDYYFMNDAEFTQTKADFTLTSYGLSSDEVLVGDWDGNSADELANRRTTVFYLQSDYKDASMSNSVRVSQATSNNDAFVIDWKE